MNWIRFEGREPEDARYICASSPVMLVERSPTTLVQSVATGDTLAVTNMLPDDLVKAWGGKIVRS